MAESITCSSDSITSSKSVFTPTTSSTTGSITTTFAPIKITRWEDAAVNAADVYVSGYRGGELVTKLEL